jgi:hypothetical protein
MNIGFFVRQFSERGTEVSTYDYARYNEEILKNKSYIICLTAIARDKNQLSTSNYSYDRFKNRFQLIEINDISDMKKIIEKYNLSFFYTQTSGGDEDIYQFNNKDLWGNCKTIKHCVFKTNYPDGDYYISISNILNEKYNTSIPVIPYMVDLPNHNENLRKELGIDEHAIVFGRYGGKTEFNINTVHVAIKQFLKKNKNVYFLFMNTSVFYEHPRIIYLDANIDLDFKVKFINTCDAMLHGRKMGETFGSSIAEFSIRNKPVITCMSGDLEHIKILGDKAIIYNSLNSLMYIFENIKTIIHSKQDWNAYRMYSPEYVMNLFQTYIFSKSNPSNS